MRTKAYQLMTHDFKEPTTFHGSNLETLIIEVITIKYSWHPNSDRFGELLKGQACIS